MPVITRRGEQPAACACYRPQFLKDGFHLRGQRDYVSAFHLHFLSGYVPHVRLNLRPFCITDFTGTRRSIHREEHRAPHDSVGIRLHCPHQDCYIAGVREGCVVLVDSWPERTQKRGCAFSVLCDRITVCPARRNCKAVYLPDDSFNPLSGLITASILNPAANVKDIP